MKTCGRCNLTKSLDDFYKNKHEKDGKHKYCRPCSREQIEASMERNQHLPCSICKEKPRVKRQTRCVDCNGFMTKASKYGITVEEAREMSKRPCAACGRYAHEIGGHAPMSIDHCHGSGRVRDTLCRYCNTALGSLMEDPERIEKLKQYAILQAQKHHESTTVSGN